MTNHFYPVSDGEIEDFIAKAKAIRKRWRDGWNERSGTDRPPDSFGYMHGRNTWWTRIYTIDSKGGAKSCYCFVDRRNGNVLFSKGWKGPVKKASGVRGSIYADTEEGLGIDWHGARYLT